MSLESDLQTVLGSFVEVSTPIPFSRTAAPGQKRLWNEADVSRESEAHEGKRPGEFAPKPHEGTVDIGNGVSLKTHPPKTHVIRPGNQYDTHYWEAIKNGETIGSGRYANYGTATQPLEVSVNPSHRGQGVYSSVLAELNRRATVIPNDLSVSTEAKRAWNRFRKQTGEQPQFPEAMTPQEKKSKTPAGQNLLFDSGVSDQPVAKPAPQPSELEKIDDEQKKSKIAPVEGQKELFEGGLEPVHHHVAKRFGIPPHAVKSLMESGVPELRRRDEWLAESNGASPQTGFETFPHGTARINQFGDPNESYVDYMTEFSPHDIEPTEPEDGIKKSQTYKDYVQWAKAGHQPPPVSVFSSNNGNGKLLTSSRRRTLAAREAGVAKIPAWHGPYNPETGNPLKYGDVMKAVNEFHSQQFSRTLNEVTPIEFSVAAPPRKRRVIDDKRTREDVDEDEKVFGKKKRIPTDGNKPETGWTKVGGSTVHVNDDGVIDKGCPGLKGEEVEDLIDESDESRERREARQAYARAAGITGDQITAEQAKAMGSDAHVEGMKQAKAVAEADPRPTIGTSDVLRGVDDQTGELAGNGHELLQSNNREHPESNEQFEGTGMPSPMKFMDDEDEGTRPQWMGPKLSEMVPIPPRPKFLRDREPLDHDAAAQYQPQIDKLEADIAKWRDARDAMKKGRDVGQFGLSPEQKTPEYADAQIKALQGPLGKLKRQLSDYRMRSTPNQNPATQTWTSLDSAAEGASSKFGIPIHHIVEAMPDAYLFRLAQSIEHESLKKAARKKLQMHAGDLARIENQHSDWSDVPRFDEASREFASENPGAGLDPYAHDTPDKVWSLIREGATSMPAKDSPEIAELAAQMISGDYNRKPLEFTSEDDHDDHGDDFSDDWGGEHGDTSFDPNSFSRWILNAGPVEFARVRPARNQSAFNWDEDAHPREATVHDGKRPGEFAAKQGVAAPQEIDHESDYKQNGTRSKAFKAWFGDWEHDPANASKVVDADGEPQETSPIDGTGSKVMRDGKPVGVYHGTNAGPFGKFEKRWGKATAGGNSENLLYGPGIYFTETEQLAKEYSSIKSFAFNGDIERLKSETEQQIRHMETHDYGGSHVQLEKSLKQLESMTPERVANPTESNDRVAISVLKNWLPVHVVDSFWEDQSQPHVFNCFLNIRKPLDADKGIPDDILGRLDEGTLEQLKTPLQDAAKRIQDAEKYISQGRAMIKLMGEQFNSPHTDEKTKAELQQSKTEYLHSINGKNQMIDFLKRQIERGISYAAVAEQVGGKTRLNEILAEAGYDGITHTGGRIMGKVEHRVWIAFEPNQIKAVNNRGTFNPEDDRLEFSRSDELDTIAERMGVDADSLRAAIASMPGPKSESLTWIRKLMHDPSRGVLRDRNGHVIGFLTRNGQKIQLRDARGHQSGTVTGSSFRDSKGHVTGTLQEFSQQLQDIEPVEFARIKPAPGQMSLFDEGNVNRETEAHEGKRPGEFAPKTEPAATPAPVAQKPRKIGKREFKAAPSTTVDFPQTNSFGPIPGVKMKHIDGTTFFTNPKDDTHVLAKVPTHHVERFMDEISGRISHPANSGHPTLDRVLSGHGTHIGKGHESTAFDAGNGMIVKAAVLTPFHISQHGVRTPAEANKIVDDSVAVTNHLRAAGVPGILPQYGIQHDGRSFAVQKKVDTQSPLKTHHFDQLEKTIQGIHNAGYAVKDQIQAGLDHNRNAAIYDIGSAAKLEGGRYDDDDKRQDFNNLAYLAKKHGVDYKTPEQRRAPNDYDSMLWHIQDHPGMTRDEARTAKLRLVGAASRTKAVDPDMHELLSDTHADAMQKLEGWINQPKVEMSRTPAAGQGSFNWDADEHPRDEIGRFKDKLHHQIKEYLSDGSHRHIRDIHDHTGHKDYDALDPLSNKANAALKELRDSGHISGTTPSIGEPQFYMTEEQIAKHKNPESDSNVTKRQDESDESDVKTDGASGKATERQESTDSGKLGSQGFKIEKVDDTRQYEEIDDDKWEPIAGSGRDHACDRCGKNHVIHYHVKCRATGKDLNVGSECAGATGIDDKSKHKTFQSAASTVKKLESMRDGIKAKLDKIPAMQAKVSEMEFPEWAVQPSSLFKKKQGDHPRFELTLGDLKQQLPDSYHGWTQYSPHMAAQALSEAKSYLRREWESNRIGELVADAGMYDPSKHGRSYGAYLPRKLKDDLESVENRLKKAKKKLESLTEPEEFSRLLDITPVEFGRKPAAGQKGFDFDAPVTEPIADKEAENEPTKQSSLFADIPAEHLDEAKKLSELHGGREVKKTKTGWQVRSPKGGKVSEVNGIHYPGGQFMPIHGLTEKKAVHPPKADRPKFPESSPQEKKEKTDGGWSGGQRSPMTLDEIEELRKRREEEKTWADIQRSPLGRLLDLGDKPKYKQGTIPFTDQWREYAERVGPVAMAEMRDQFEKEVHGKIDKEWQDAINEQSSMTDDQIMRRHGLSSVGRFSPEDAEWDKNQLKESAESSATQWKPRAGRAIEKSVPGTHYVRELIGHILSTDNGIPIGEMKRIGDILASHESASRADMADPVEAKKNGYYPNKFSGTTASGKKVKAGDGWVKKNQQTGKYETYTDDEVKSAIQQFSRDLEICLQEFSNKDREKTEISLVDKTEEFSRLPILTAEEFEFARRPYKPGEGQGEFPFQDRPDQIDSPLGEEPVQSSNMHSFRWEGNDTTGSLLVRFKAKNGGPGPLYRVSVPKSYYEGLKKTAQTNGSAGGWYWDNIRVRGSVAGHQHPVSLVGTGPTGYVPRAAGLRRGYTGEHFNERTLNGVKSTLTPAPVRKGPAKRIPGYDPSKLKLPGESQGQPSQPQVTTQSQTSSSPSPAPAPTQTPATPQTPSQSPQTPPNTPPNTTKGLIDRVLDFFKRKRKKPGDGPKQFSREEWEDVMLILSGV
jgi:hypothetical protein